MSDTASGTANIVDIVEKNPLFIKGKCFIDGCETTLAVGQEKTQFYVCMDQLAKLSEYFRAMFFGKFKEKNQKQFEIKDETPENMIYFFNAIDADPKIGNITGDSVELLMRLADKFQCDVLKERLKDYIKINEPTCENASTILDWLVWSVQYHMPKETIDVCLPGAACLALSTLSVNKEKIGFELYSKLLEAKLQLNFRSIIFCNKKITFQRCSYTTCGMVDSLPYNIYLCSNVAHNAPLYVLCSGCYKKGRSTNKCTCGSQQYHFYDKCRLCQLDPSSYKDKDQCLCARNNYKMFLEKIM